MSTKRIVGSTITAVLIVILLGFTWDCAYPWVFGYQKFQDCIEAGEQECWECSFLAHTRCIEHSGDCEWTRYAEDQCHQGVEDAESDYCFTP